MGRDWLGGGQTGPYGLDQDYVAEDKNKGGDGGSGYPIKKAVGDFGEPQFPATDKAGYMRLLELAVPKATHRIASVDHPIYTFEVEGRPEA
jgi:hypothetical protein